MTGKTLVRVGAVTGILHVVLGMTGFVVHGYPQIGANGQQLASWASGTNVARFATGAYIEALGFLLLIPFAAWLYSLLRTSDKAVDWLLTTGFAAAVAFVAVTIPINAVWQAVLQGGKAGVDPAVMVIVRDAAQLTFQISPVFLGLFMLVTGILLAQTRVVGLWAGVPALLVGVAALVPALAEMGTIFFWLWVLAVSIYLLVRPAAVERAVQVRRTASSASPAI